MKIASVANKPAHDVYAAIRKSGRANGFDTKRFANWSPLARHLRANATLTARKRFRITFVFVVKSGKLCAWLEFHAPGFELNWMPSSGEVLRDRVRRLVGYGIPKKSIEAAIKFLDGIVA